MHNVIHQDWGLIDYKEAWDQQQALQSEVIQVKRSGEERSSHGYLVTCEHPAVYTLGRSGKAEHLLIGEEERSAQGLGYYEINRGGDITYHGPGQLVGYPILDLEHWYRDVHRYVRDLEEVIIRVLAQFGIEGLRDEGYTGVWTEAENGHRKKICAMGIHFSRWVSMHGFALNVSSNLSHFDHIVPCGIAEPNRSVTSMVALTGQDLSLDEVRMQVVSNFADVFDINWIKHYDQQ